MALSLEVSLLACSSYTTCSQFHRHFYWWKPVWTTLN